MLASMTWKSGRRRKRSAARAVVGAERLGGGEAAAARAPSTKRGRTPEPDAKRGQFDPGGKTQRTQYGRSYPALDLSPVRREGSTGPERPQRRRPHGQECYVESRLAGVKRRKQEQVRRQGCRQGDRRESRVVVPPAPPPPAPPCPLPAPTTYARRTRAPPRESGADLRGSVDAIVVCHVSEKTSQ